MCVSIISERERERKKVSFYMLNVPRKTKDNKNILSPAIWKLYLVGIFVFDAIFYKYLDIFIYFPINFLTPTDR